MTARPGAVSNRSDNEHPAETKLGHAFRLKEVHLASPVDQLRLIIPGGDVFDCGDNSAGSGLCAN